MASDWFYGRRERVEAAGCAAVRNRLDVSERADLVDGLHLVPERSPDGTVGVMVGPAAQPEDFRGPARMKEAAGDRFTHGILLYDGPCVRRTAASLFAMPVKMLREA